MLATDLMTLDPAVIPGTSTLRESANLMLARGVGFLPVVDHVLHRQLLGVITDRDLVVRQNAQGHGELAKVHEHMSRAPIATVTPFATLDIIAEAMRTHRVRRVPVVDADGCVIGVIGLSDFVRRGGEAGVKAMHRVMESLAKPGVLVP